jgi:murein DD-endopeptidase MepM/ murein hydrolase activator NlpD
MPAAIRILACLSGLLLVETPGGSPQAQPAAPMALEVSHTARALHPGEIVTLRVSSPTPLQSLEAEWAGRTRPLWADSTGMTWTGLVGLDVEVAPGSQRVVITGVTRGGATARAEHALEVAPKQFAERHLRVDPRFSDPPPSARPRIAREAARLEEIFRSVTRGLTPDVPFAAPVPEAPNSRFGLRSFFNKQPRGRHNGVDFPSPAGTPVHAPAGGHIVLVDALYFTGNTVVIDHGYGVYTLFAHLERTATTAGADVARGALVGYVGSTGRATGPHLHWSLRLNGARVDPTSLMTP